MKIGLAIHAVMIICTFAQVAIARSRPPTVFVAGFGSSVDAHGNLSYTVYGQTFDKGVAGLTLECHPIGSLNQREWTAMGMGVPVSDDSTLWAATWQPCLLSADEYELRMVAIDSLGDSAPDLQPILQVAIDDCKVTPTGPSQSPASAWFDAVRFDRPCAVHVEGSGPDFHHTVIAVFEDQNGGLTAEEIRLLRPDPDSDTRFVGSFDPSTIRHGGVGRFWVAYTDNNQSTHLTYAQITVGCVTPISSPAVVNDQICAHVKGHSDALASGNCIVLYPSAMPEMAGGSSVQVWPNCATGELITSVALTEPPGFDAAEYVEIHISYRATVPDECLSVMRWPPSNIILAPSGIRGGTATFYAIVSEIEGLYAVASSPQSCQQQTPLPRSTHLAQNYPNPFNSGTVMFSGQLRCSTPPKDNCGPAKCVLTWSLIMSDLFDDRTGGVMRT